MPWSNQSGGGGGRKGGGAAVPGGRGRPEVRISSPTWRSF